MLWLQPQSTYCWVPPRSWVSSAWQSCQGCSHPCCLGNFFLPVNYWICFDIALCEQEAPITIDLLWLCLLLLPCRGCQCLLDNFSLNILRYWTSDFQRKLKDARPNNTDELKATVKATWASITSQQCHRLIAPMPRHTDAVIQTKGAPTKYWVHNQTYFPECQHFHILKPV